MRRDDNAILLDIAHAVALVAKFATRDIPELLDWVTPLLPEEPA